MVAIKLDTTILSRYLPQRWLGFRTSALTEALFLIGLLLVFDFLFGDGTRFLHISPHPLWVPVLLISCQYGTNEGLVTTLLCTLALYVGNLPTHHLTMDRFQYLMSIVQTPVLWLSMATLIGEMRNKHRDRQETAERKLTECRNREKEIAEAYERIQHQKEALQRRLAGNFHTALDTFDALAELETLDSQKVLSHSAEFVAEILKPTKFSLFLKKEGELQCVFRQNWEDSDTYQTTFSSSSSLFHDIVGRQQTLCIVNIDHQDILGNEGLLAGPILDSAHGEVLGMLKFEDINFKELNITTVHTFEALCQWIGKAYRNALDHEKAEANSLVSNKSALFSHKFYEQQLDFATSLGKRLNFDVCQVVVDLDDAIDIAPSDKSRLANALHDAVMQSLRTTDQAFDDYDDSSRFVILLPNTPIKHADIVLNHIREALGDDAPSYRFTSQCIYEAAGDDNR